MEDLSAAHAWLARLELHHGQPLLAIAVIYFLYALAHTAIDLLEKSSGKISKAIRRMCSHIALVALYFIAFVYAIEYLATAAS